MSIIINSRDLEHIKKHGEEDYPHECCGFLFGKNPGKNKTVMKLQAVQNSRESDDRHNRYLISPQEFLKAEKMARESGLEIMGFYHSHPDSEARPSQYDLDYSWPVYSYIIVSVKNQESKEVTSWQIKDDRSAFLEEEIIIENRSDQNV